ncbi:lipid-binding SYLF domain-containing protein [Altericista sp. CCNU0014]|uniref:lipid-binding SYLF domain-containing protein n=1 Tax=Altericista sp. CCNU0014 TaxID=3082949 RepID=UPI0038501F08
MNFHRLMAVPVAALVISSTSYPAFAASDSTKTVSSANTVLQEFVNSKRIPPRILQNSQGIAIIPNVVQAAFFLGGRRGQGVMMLRNSNGSWSNPVIMTLTSGSLGLQVGAKSSDIIMAFQDNESIRKVYNSDFRLGGSVSGTAGPTGADAVYPTDSTGNIYTYVKSEGLFGGVALSGMKLDYDDDKTADLYGQRNITARQVFTGTSVTPPTIVGDLQRTLSRAISSR